MDRSIQFYQEFFNMRLVRRRDIQKNNAEIAFLDDGEDSSFSLELTRYHDQRNFAQAVYDDRLFDHLAFVVRDLRSDVGRIKKAGYTVTDEPFELSPGKWLAFVEDPDGTLIELIQE